MRLGRILLIGFVLLVLANLWVRQGALITLAAQVAMAVPPVPALAALLVLLGALGLLRRIGISREDVIGVYAFLTLAVALTSGAAMRFFLPALSTPYYFASTENRWAEFFRYIPTWMVPQGDEVIRRYFEGSDGAPVPWDAWAGPLAAWLAFFVALYGLLMCIALVFRPVWEQSEHLAYPMAELPVMLAGYRRDTLHGLWTNGLFWTGFALICLHNLFNILNAFNPAVTALGLETNLNNLLNEHPLTALRPLVFRYRPLIFGMAYMMPGDIVISTLLFYFVYLKGLALFGAVRGLQLPQFPYYRQQSMGSMVGMTAVVIYGARHRIRAVFARLAGRGDGSRWLPLLLIASALVVYGFWALAGMSWWVILAYYGLILSSAITYLRARAETGYPHHWIKPLDQERQILISLLGTERLAPGGNFRSLTLLTVQHFLSRGYLPQLAAFPLEAFRMAREITVDLRRMIVLMVVAVVLGSLVSWWMHIDTAYVYGANILEGGTTSGGQRVALTVNAYEALAGWMRGPAAPNRPQAIAASAGAGLVIVLAALRRLFISFPLHPMGYVFALTGAGENGWAALLVCTIIKQIALRIGGMRLYNRLLPFFLGAIVGHFFAAGTVWSLIASYGGEGFNKYPVWF